MEGSKHESNEQILEATITDLNQLNREKEINNNERKEMNRKKEDSDGVEKSFHWMDLVLEEDDGGGERDRDGQGLEQVTAVDRAVQAIYAAAPSKSFVLVVTQGTLKPLKQMISQKLRSS